jgi:hypothetical protein
MTDELMGQVQLAGEHSSITSTQWCSRGPESTGNRMAGFRVLSTSSRYTGFHITCFDIWSFGSLSANNFFYIP